MSRDAEPGAGDREDSFVLEHPDKGGVVGKGRAGKEVEGAPGQDEVVAGFPRRVRTVFLQRF